MARDFPLADLDVGPKLAPDPVAGPGVAPETNGVEKSGPAGVVGTKDAAVLLNIDGAEPDGGNVDDWGDAADGAKKDAGVEVAGVEYREDDEVAAVGAADRVVKSENPPPDEAAETAADDCRAVNDPEAAELAINPAT